MSKKPPVYQLRISLEEIRPMIWRRVLVPADLALDRLHEVFQLAMGWENYHLHMFTAGKVQYGIPDNELPEIKVLDETEYTVADLADEEKARFRYEYDFGDSWWHSILVERIYPPTSRRLRPVCLAGERACPPEDCGGTPGFEEFLKAIRDSRHEDHEDMLRWIGGSYDAAAFDLAAINARLQGLKI